MSWIDFVGYLAALMILATFCMDTIVPLRGLAIASNVLFILYGIAGQLYPCFFFTPCCSRSTSQRSFGCGCKCGASTAAPWRVIARLELRGVGLRRNAGWKPRRS